ncbi:hypothetical protein TPA0910_26950 [Streptomyces hygroscopicus subsp. sporocinereus]|uniref:Uncharacterized protein n=1 Tax=Streptomyces hygroscopicus TaxID=1912 RepID=A0ABQ3TY14_STRHY|nr:DUF6247 family protein [Streptomyces hygroscopicus]GHJ28262.1 hypothetical protein TPA0910_26950 [Streptomyces hygroscopicus]
MSAEDLRATAIRIGNRRAALTPHRHLTGEPKGIPTLMTTESFEGGTAVPPMPDRTPKSLRAAIAQHAPQLLVDFDRHWRRDIADAYDLAPVPAFMARWWGEYALARDPELEARVHRLEDEAAQEGDYARAKAMIEEAGRIRRTAAKAEPGQ